MYMEYFFRRSELNKGAHPKEKDLESNDTFLLALDGDIDFKPEAVTRLLDVMICKSKFTGFILGGQNADSVIQISVTS